MSSIPTRAVPGLVGFFLYEVCFSWLGKKKKKKEDLALIEIKLSFALSTLISVS